MRALAEFVMRGKAQAIAIAMLAIATDIFAWAGASIVALVILRRGVKEGITVLLWSSLPAMVLAMWGDVSPLAGLLGTAAVAIVLRMTVSLPLALVAAVLSGVVTGLALSLFAKPYIEEVVRFIAELFTQLQNQAGAEAASYLQAPNATQVLGFLGLGNTITVVTCLIIARWWQAMLYNPGGFRQEFHGLRLTPPLTVLLLVMGIAMSLLGPDYRFWAFIVVVPFVFAGFALVHSVVAQKQLSGHWLGFFYMVWLFLDPLKLLLVLVVIADSWIDIRGRIAKA